MRFDIPDKYPTGLNDEEIQEVIMRLEKQMSGNDRITDVVVRQTALIQLGLAELQKRNNEKSYETTVQSAKSSNKLSKFALILSVVAIIITAVFGSLDYFGDKKWQEKQIGIIEEIKSNSYFIVNYLKIIETNNYRAVDLIFSVLSSLVQTMTRD